MVRVIKILEQDRGRVGARHSDLLLPLANAEDLGGELSIFENHCCDNPGLGRHRALNMLVVILGLLFTTFLMRVVTLFSGNNEFFSLTNAEGCDTCGH